MKPLNRTRCQPNKIRPLGLTSVLCAVTAIALSLLAQSNSQQPARPSYLLEPQPIYSDDPHDSWNRIFCILFSRRIEANLSSDFPEAAPFQQHDENRDVTLSTRLFERIETGDRAIDPLYYPANDTREGRRQLLLEPVYSEFMSAMQDALADNSPRAPLARAWMQSDLWSAYDILGEPLFAEDRSRELEARHQAALDALARLIRKVALTPEEIRALPDNYSQSASKFALPDLFHNSGGWVEIQWFPDRAHDGAAEYRRYSRIFVKLPNSVRNTQKALDALRESEGDAKSALDGAAILIQLILIDSHGKLTPTHLTAETEFRLFERASDGTFKRTNIRVCEISRQLLLRDSQAGGLVYEDETSQAYFGSYTFASPSFAEGPADKPGHPIVVTIRRRCMHCHGPDVTDLMSFEIKEPPHFHGPHVKQLDPSGYDSAADALSHKQKLFNSLAAHF
jgi:hypothetical protein